MKNGIEVFIRARPTDDFAYKNITVDQEKNTVALHIPKKHEDGIVNHQQEYWNFKFEKILLNETQEHVFECTGKRAVSWLVEGLSCSLLTYGQTGAGKTFTVIGLNNDYRFRGLIPRALSQLFHETAARTDTSFTVKLSFIEIYNEAIHDLLNKDADNISLQEDPVYGVMPKGTILATVNSEEEALALMFQGEINRTIREHKLNKNSSRSHAIFTILLESRSKFESKEKVTISKLNIIDLAGSERSKKTLSREGTLLEASFINKSLSYLEQLVVAYSDNK